MGTPREPAPAGDPDSATGPEAERPPSPPAPGASPPCGDPALSTHAAETAVVAEPIPVAAPAQEPEPIPDDAPVRESDAAPNTSVEADPAPAPNRLSPADDLAAAAIGAPPALTAPTVAADMPTPRAASPGASGPDAPAAPSGDAPGSPADDGFLEELILPSAIQALAPLPEGTTIGPAGTVRIERLLDTRGRLNRYRASVLQGDGGAAAAELREAPADHPDLRREAEILATVRYAMLPQLLAAFEQEDRRYLALARQDDGETLAGALERGLPPERAIAIILQLTQVLRRLHTAGWALLGLQPAHIILGNPLRITALGSAARIGEAAGAALSVAGYSAQETAHRAIVTGKEDVYTLGAFLYRALVGAPVPEQGPELAALGALVRLPGAPQLLDAALAPAEERADLETFYRQLLAFKERRSRQAVALEFAGGTTVGLNRTRPVNEDAYACTTWSIAHHERSTYRALLCVVDGMGGMEAGEVASQAAVRAVLGGVANLAGPDGPPPDPVALVKAAAAAVHEAARGRAVGATITCAVVDDGAITLAHVGDTRAYLLRDGILTQLTQDHSLVAAMVASGVLTAAEARGHPDSNKVLRSLGGRRELGDEYIDTLATTRGERALRLRAGDRLLLCSDGIWGVVEDGALRDLLLGSDDCATIVQDALRRALDGGAPDNATLIVARCIPLPGH